MHRFKDIMVALARSDADAELIQYTAAFAKLGTATQIRFVHVVPASTAPLSAAERASMVESLQNSCRSHFAVGDMAASISCDVLEGPLVDQLLTYAAEQQVDLLLVGSGHQTSSRRTLARRLAMKAPCSIWMKPRGTTGAINRILVPVDFSEHAADAMRVAISMAQSGGHAELVAVHIYFNEAVTSFEGYDAILRGQEQEAYEQFMTAIDSRGVTVTPVLEESANVAHAISRVAERVAADLIVMGTRGRSRSAAILLGSETEQLLVDTAIPVLVVKHYGARLSMLESLLDRKFWKQGSLRTD